MEHPTICFGISRHNVIIPLKVVEVVDFKDGCFQYKFAVNHPKPTGYMECHQKADFEDRFVTADRPLCTPYTKIRLTLAEAKELATKELNADRQATLRELNSIDKSLAKIDQDAAELEEAIASMES